MILIKALILLLSALLVIRGLEFNDRNIEALQAFCANTMWLHTPKTSSSLCLTLDNICCNNHFNKVLFNISTDQLLLLAQSKEYNKSNREMRYDSAYGCFSFLIAQDVNKNNSLKKEWMSTRSYQTNVTNMCVRYKTMSHDPDNNIYNIRNMPGKRIKYRYNDNNNEAIYHEYGNSYNSLTHKMITIIREPKSRLISSMLDSFHSEGISKIDYQKMLLYMKTLDNGDGSLRDRMLKKLQYVITFPHFYGCQVKLLNGVPCLSKLLVSEGFNQTALDFAIKRLKQYMFVGIFERYTDSIKMLHFYANLSTKPHPIEFIKLRTTSNNISSYIKQKLDFYDPYDSKLYDAALDIFNEKYEYYKKYEYHNNT